MKVRVTLDSCNSNMFDVTDPLFFVAEEQP